MRVELTLHTYVEVFNRLISLRFDPKDWEFRISKTSATRIFYLGPIHIGYTNQNILNERIKEMIENYEKDFEDYQVKEKIEPVIKIVNDTSNILN